MVKNIFMEAVPLRFRNWLQRTMSGRYGPDQLNMAMLILAVILTIVASITRLGLLNVLSYIMLILCFIRMLSRNLTARRRENDKFLKYWWPIRTKLQKLFDKNYRFFKCPACRCTLRVPRRKGKIQVTCPKCGERFTKKT